MYANNVFFVSDDPYMTSENFYNTMIYKNKKIIPFDTTWLAIEEDIKFGKQQYYFYEQYSYTAMTEGYIKEYKIPGVLYDIETSDSINGYELHPDGYYKIDNYIFQMNNISTTENITKIIYLKYDWGNVELKHIIYYDGIRPASTIMVNITRNKEFIPKKNIKNRLIDYFSKYSDVYEYHYEINPSILKYNSIPTNSNSVDYFNNSSIFEKDSIIADDNKLVYKDLSYIKEIHFNDVFDYEYEPTPGIFIDLNTGYVALNLDILQDSITQTIKVYTVNAIYTIDLEIILTGGNIGFSILEYNDYMSSINQSTVTDIENLSIDQINELLSLMNELDEIHFTYSANQLNVLVEIIDKSLDILELDNSLTPEDALLAAISDGNYSDILMMSENELNNLINTISDDTILYISSEDYLLELKETVTKMLLALDVTNTFDEAFDEVYNSSVRMKVNVSYVKRLDDSIFIDSLDMLKSSAMKMLTRSNNYFEANKIPITKQITETYEQIKNFNCETSIVIEDGIYDDADYVSTTLLQLCNIQLTGLVTTNFEFINEKRTVKNIQSSEIILNDTIILIERIDDLSDTEYPPYNEILQLDNKVSLYSKNKSELLELKNSIITNTIIIDNITYMYYSMIDEINLFDDSVTYYYFVTESTINFSQSYESDVFYSDNTDDIHVINITNLNYDSDNTGYSNNYVYNQSQLLFDNYINMSIIFSEDVHTYFKYDNLSIISNISKIAEINDNNVYEYYKFNDNIILDIHSYGYTNTEPYYFNGSYTMSRPIIGDIPTSTFESDLFHWSYIALNHSLRGKYFTDVEQRGALHDLNSWLLPVQWIFDQINIANENIQIDFVKDYDRLRDNNIIEMLQNVNLQIITEDQLMRFRNEFEDRFMNNTHGQVDYRKYNSQLIDDQYNLLNFVTNQFYNWIWKVLWKYWNKHNTFYNFVDAIIKFGIPIIIEAYYAYDYEGDGLERFNMYIISEISRYIKVKFVNEIAQERHQYRNIFIYNSYFRRKTLELNHNYWGRQFSRIHNIYFVKLYNELIIDQYKVRVNKDIYESGWVNYFMNFYDNYDYDVYIPYKDTVVYHDTKYLDDKHTHYNYIFRDKIYPTMKGVDFEFTLSKKGLVDACYIYENRYNKNSSILHYNNKFIPVGKSHNESIHIMQNKIWFKYYSQINNSVINKVHNYAISKHNVDAVGYIMTENISMQDYLNIDNLPQNSDIYLNLNTMGLSYSNNIDYLESFFNYETHPDYKRFDRLSAIIDINDLPINPLEPYILLLKKYISSFMLIYKIRNGVINNKHLMTQDIQKALNIFGHRLVIYIDCQYESDYLIGRLIGTRLMNSFNNINIAIDLIDHVKQNEYDKSIDFDYSDRLQDAADYNMITLYNGDVEIYMDIYKYIVNDSILYINGSIDSNVQDDENNTEGYGEIKISSLLTVYKIEQDNSLVYIDGDVENSLIDSLNVKIYKV